MSKLARIAFALLLLGLGLTACGRGDLNAPTVTSVLFVPSKTPALPTATPDPAQAIKRGEALFTTFYDQAGFACSTCHHVDSEERLVGPGLLNLKTWVETNISNQTPQEYIHESIVNPSVYLVEGYPDNLMPQVYGTLFNEAQLNDIVAYLLSL